jgi:hypothetical protein
MRDNCPLSSSWKRTSSWRRTDCFFNSSWLLSPSSASSSISGGPTRHSPCPSHPAHPTSADAHARTNPRPFPRSSANRCARPVSREPRPGSQPRLTPSDDSLPPGTPAHRRHPLAFLSGSRWLLSGLARSRHPPRPWPSRRPALAPGARCFLAWILLRDARHALSWHALLGGADRTRQRVSG